VIRSRRTISRVDDVRETTSRERYQILEREVMAFNLLKTMGFEESRNTERRTRGTPDRTK
jgi:hypothetical protein